MKKKEYASPEARALAIALDALAPISVCGDAVDLMALAKQKIHMVIAALEKAAEEEPDGEGEEHGP